MALQALGKPLAARVAYPNENSMRLEKRAITGLLKGDPNHAEARRLLGEWGQ